MKSYLVFVFLGILLFGGYFLFSSNKELPVNQIPLEKPWVKVVTSGVYLRSSNGTSTELRSGDLLSEGNSLFSEGNGQADIYFPNGSVARLDQGSSITINQAHFDENSSSVKIFLLEGRLWSKIFSGGNTRNEWEVRTENAVATVRGTAFGIQFEKGKSVIIGSENKVLVSPLQADGTPKEDASIIVSEKMFVRVEDATSSTPLTLTPEPINERLPEYRWVMDNQSADKLLQKEFEKGADVGGESAGLEALKEYSQILREEERVSQKNSSEAHEEPLMKPIEDPILPRETKTLEKKTSTQENHPQPTSTPLSLRISGGTDTLREGEKTSYRAMLRFSDGTEKEVTQTVEWKVVGLVGKISKEGIFEAALDPSISEQGKGIGAVLAIFTIDEGKVLSAQTSLFTVLPNFINTRTDIGGQ